jgi:hypothetical protein
MTHKIQALIAFAVMSGVAMLPAVAWACPYCVSQNKDAGLAGVALLGSMIVLPFVVFLVVAPALKRVASADADIFPPDSE